MAENDDCNVTLEEETPIIRKKSPQKNGMKIMTVDDSATMRMILKNIISNNKPDKIACSSVLLQQQPENVVKKG